MCECHFRSLWACAPSNLKTSTLSNSSFPTLIELGAWICWDFLKPIHISLVFLALISVLLRQCIHWFSVGLRYYLRFYNFLAYHLFSSSPCTSLVDVSLFYTGKSPCVSQLQTVKWLTMCPAETLIHVVVSNTDSDQLIKVICNENRGYTRNGLTN